MVSEARLEGGVPQGGGWFVLNAHETRWWHGVFGKSCVFEGEGDAQFSELGINLNVLEPGQPMCMYHGEDAQEDFLVLGGEALLLVEGEERPLRTWDFVHCPPWTEHVFVGAGSGPCLILAVGSRAKDDLLYPVNETALRHNAGVEQETKSGNEAYARFPKPTVGPAPDLP